MCPPSSGRKRQQVQERERHADEPEDLEVVAEADLQRLLRTPGRCRRRSSAAPRSFVWKRPPNACTGPGDDVPAVVRGRRALWPSGYETSSVAGDEAPDPAAVCDWIVALRAERDACEPPRRTVTVIGFPLLAADQRATRRSNVAVCLPFTATTLSPA